MTPRAALSPVPPASPGPLAVAAREACALCHTFDGLAEEAGISIDDPERLADLLTQRDVVVAQLDVHLAALRSGRSPAAGSQPAEAQAAASLMLQVRESLETSLTSTSALIARAAERGVELRQEIAAINRAESAQHAYVPHVPAVHLDSRR